MTKFFKKHIFILATIIIILIWLAFFFGVIWVANDLKLEIPPSMELQSLNNFGSSFNALTSLFTALSFAGVIISIHLQSDDLKEAISAFKGQESSLKNQEFDNKFFQMLDFFTRLKENIKTKIDGESYSGNDAFKPLVKKLLDSVDTKLQEDNPQNINDLFKKEFVDFNNQYEIVKYYFLNLYQILNYINKKSTHTDSAKLYTNILRAQLSKNELILLAYNSIGVQAFTTENYQNLVEEYSFFEHLKLDDFLNDNENKQKIIITILKNYQAKSFGNNDEFFKKLKDCHDNYYNV